jgi:hypothetical protein
VGLVRGPLSLVSTTEQLVGKKSSGPGLENREYGNREPSRLLRGTLFLQKLALTLPTIGGRSVGIVSSRTQPTGFHYLVEYFLVRSSLDYRLVVIFNIFSRFSSNLCVVCVFVCISPL